MKTSETKQGLVFDCRGLANGARVRAAASPPRMCERRRERQRICFFTQGKESGTGAHTRGCGSNASTPSITSPRVFFRSPPLWVSPPRVAPPRFGMPSNVGGAPAASHTQHTSLEFEQIPSNHLVLTARSHGGVVRRVATSCAMTVLILLCIYFDTAHSPHSFAVALSSWERAYMYEITLRDKMNILIYPTRSQARCCCCAPPRLHRPHGGCPHFAPPTTSACTCAALGPALHRSGDVRCT